MQSFLSEVAAAIAISVAPCPIIAEEASPVPTVATDLAVVVRVTTDAQHSAVSNSQHDDHRDGNRKDQPCSGGGREAPHRDALFTVGIGAVSGLGGVVRLDVMAGHYSRLFYTLRPRSETNPTSYTVV